MSSFTWPSTSGGGVSTYANLAAFPALSFDGDLGIALDTHTLYEYNAGAAAWQPIASPGAVLSIGTIDSQSKSANGGVISSNALVFQTASATFPGLVSTGVQTFAGNKTFTGSVSASNFSGSSSGVNTGDVTLTVVGSSPNVNAATLTGQVLNLEPASASFPGVMTTGVQTIAGAKTFSGGITATVTGTASGNTTYTPNNHGVVLSGAANAMTVLAPNASTALPLISGGSSADPSWGVLSIAGGGTGQVTKAAAFDALSPMTTGGDIIYGGVSGTATRLPNGSAGQVLQSNGTTLAPSWAPAGTGTVTSVGLSVPGSSIFGTTGTPVTGSGTLGLTVTGTSGGIPYFDTTSTLSSSALLANHGVMLGAGAGAAPKTLAVDSSTTKVLTSGGSSADPSWAAVAGSSFATQTAGTFLAGPTSGSAATPTFRALQSPTVQKFTSGSGTYTTAAGVLWIRVRMVGAGGGGAGGGTAAGTSAGAGAASTFGTTLLSAGGGGGGTWPYTPGTGGTSSLGSGPIGTALTGGSGVTSYGGGGATAANISGSNGGSSALGGAGYGGTPASVAAQTGAANTGGGGGGGQSGSSANCTGGSGGGAGGFIDAIIASPSATYAYVVGAGGSAGGAGTGTGAQAGAVGGSGYIEVTEFYQ